MSYQHILISGNTNLPVDMVAQWFATRMQTESVRFSDADGTFLSALRERLLDKVVVVGNGMGVQALVDRIREEKGKTWMLIIHVNKSGRKIDVVTSKYIDIREVKIHRGWNPDDPQPGQLFPMWRRLEHIWKEIIDADANCPKRGTP